MNTWDVDVDSIGGMFVFLFDLMLIWSLLIFIIFIDMYIRLLPTADFLVRFCEHSPRGACAYMVTAVCV